MVKHKKSWLRRIFERKQAVGFTVVSTGDYIPPNYKGAEQITEGIEKNSVIYACINLIATAMTEAEWILAKGEGEQRQEIENHPILDLMRKPRTQRGGWSLWVKDFCHSLLSTGNAFVRGIMIGNVPRELEILRPDLVGIKLNAERNKVVTYTYNEQLRLPPEEVMHVRLFPSQDNPFMGLSPLKAGAYVVDTDNFGQLWNRGLMKNRGRPDSLFMFRRTLSEEERERFKAQLDSRYSGGGNAGLPLVVEAEDFDYKELSTSPRELDFLGSQSSNGRRICQLYGVPPELIGDPQNKTYSNQAEARLALVEQTVFSLLNLLRDELNVWLVPKYGDGLELDYDEDSFGVISEKRRGVYDSLNNTTFLSLNEKRIAAGYEPILDDPDADVPQDLLGQRALASLAERPIQAPPDPNAEEPPPEEPPPEDNPEDGKKSVNMDPGYLNLDTEEKRTAFWRLGDLKRRAFEVVAQKAFASHFREEGRVVARAFKSGGEKAALQKIDSRTGSMAAILGTLYARVGNWFFNETESGMGISRKDSAASRREMRAVFGRRAKDNASFIQGTSRGSIRDLIAKFLLGDGSNVEETADAIQEAYTEMSDLRVATLASTEVNQAANGGSIYGAKATEKVLLKEWITQRDGRVRSYAAGDAFDHVGADGQAVGLDDLFSVSGEQMEFPADSGHGASAGNIVNCRCFVAFKETAA